MDEESQPNDPTAEDRPQTVGDRLLKSLGIDLNKWTVGDRRLALLGVGIGLAIVVIAVCGYVFGWGWTGLTERTFWDWLSLLIVPLVLALGGYLFTRSESRRTREFADQQRTLDREIADQQRTLDREIADQRRQDDMLQAYLDGMSQLLTDEKRPLHRAQQGDSLSMVARARTLTVLTRLGGDRKGSVVRFLHEAGLIDNKRPILDLRGSDLSEADLSGAYLGYVKLSEADLSGANLIRAFVSKADLSGADLSRANLFGVDLHGANLSDANLDKSRGVPYLQLARRALTLSGATMPNGQKYEEWLKDKEGREEDG